MVAYFCHHLSDNYVDLSDLYIDLSDHYVDLSENYVELSDNDVDLSDIKLTSRWQLVALTRYKKDIKLLIVIIFFLTSRHNDLTSRHK